MQPYRSRPPSRLKFSTERELKTYCLAVLKSKNISAREEVWCGNVRADIVTDRAMMELKKVLDRAALYQAYGQSMTYQQHLNKSEVWIVGQTPTDPAERATAFTVAREISRRGVKVSFIESDPFWQLRSVAIPTRFNFFNWFTLSRQSVAILSIISIALISTVSIPRTRSSQDSPSNSFVSVPITPALTAPSPSAKIPPYSTTHSPTVRLRVCNGGSFANFRQSPLLNAPVLDVLQVGDVVQPTGSNRWRELG